MSSDLVPAEQHAILRALNINPADPVTKATLLIADKYGLDPMLGHVVVVQGKPYFTHAALLHVAHRSGQLNGIQTVTAETQTHWKATCTVYRRDMAHGFTYEGFAAKAEKGADPRAKAITRAERAALRRAFDIGLEIYEDAAATEMPVARPPLPATGQAVDSFGPTAATPVAALPAAVPAGEDPTAQPPLPAEPKGRKKKAELPAERPPLPVDPSFAVEAALTMAEVPPARPLEDGEAGTRAKQLAISARNSGVAEDLQRDFIGYVTAGRTTSRKEVTDEEAAKLHELYYKFRRKKIELTYDETKQLVVREL